MNYTILFDEHYTVEERRRKQYYQTKITNFKHIYNKELECIRREYNGAESGIEKDIYESALRAAYKRYKANMNQLLYPWCIMITL